PEAPTRRRRLAPALRSPAPRLRWRPAARAAQRDSWARRALATPEYQFPRDSDLVERSLLRHRLGTLGAAPVQDPSDGPGCRVDDEQREDRLGRLECNDDQHEQDEKPLREAHSLARIDVLEAHVREARHHE